MKQTIPENYKDLGWQNGWKHVYFDQEKNVVPYGSKEAKSFGYLEEDYPEYGKCIRLKHKRRSFDNSSRPGRGLDNVVICDVCNILWHYDSSD